MKIRAPWTEDEVHALNRWQLRGDVHPFTCAKCPTTLIAYVFGWRCPTCNYQQDWAHDFMLQSSANP